MNDVMNDVMNSLFGPLHKDYCNYYYVLSILWFIAFIGAILSLVLVTTFKKRGSIFYLKLTAILGLFYFLNRLLHAMCVNSL